VLTIIDVLDELILRDINIHGTSVSRNRTIHSLSTQSRTEKTEHSYLQVHVKNKNSTLQRANFIITI
jgi:hypothetical protein